MSSAVAARSAVTHIDVVPPAQELGRQSYRASGPEGSRELRPEQGALREGDAFELGASCRCGPEINPKIKSNQHQNRFAEIGACGCNNAQVRREP